MTDFLSVYYCYAGDQSKKLFNSIPSRVSPGAYPLTKRPEDFGYEIVSVTLKLDRFHMYSTSCIHVYVMIGYSDQSSIMVLLHSITYPEQVLVC